MRPSRKGWWSACLAAAIGLAGAPLPARAQVLVYEDARRDLDLAPDPIARSARLLGMGRLSLVLPDVRTRLNLWDYAGHPAGVLAADSVSELAFRPSAWSASSARDGLAYAPGIEVQDFAGHENRIGYEVWRRSANRIAFGAIGDLGQLRYDRPYDADLERRSSFATPDATVILNAEMPFLAPDRTTYAIRARVATEEFSDEFRFMERNASGVYVDGTGQLTDPPGYFDIDEHTVETAGVGLALSYRAGDALTAAVGGDYLRLRIDARNDGDRYLSTTEESRPYGLGQVSLGGRLGHGLEWVADGRLWSASSGVKYVFTLSSGVGGVPTIGRGDLYDREEAGRSARGRLRFTSGAWELGASVAHGYRKDEIAPPPSSDRESFNQFLYRVYAGSRTDSVGLPDSIRTNTIERTALEFGGGVGWRPSSRGGVGVEFHLRDQELDQTVAGLGPKRKGWDVRGGVEWLLTPVLTGRGGYLYRWDDHDDLTESNEYVSHAATAGLGLRPAGSRWSLETGYAFEWGQADFGSPARPRFTRQQLGAELRWVF
jgi:hypothetical protein